MEIFVFPELMYSLVLANILSPRIWRWRDDPWFAGIERMKPYRRLQRLKQYVMDHYVFNLDLDTWGLTRQEKELARFAPFLSKEVIAQSNALFGYQRVEVEALLLPQVDPMPRFRVIRIEICGQEQHELH